jgi:hypothetical protein
MSDVFLNGKEVVSYFCPTIITQDPQRHKTDSQQSLIKHYLINQTQPPHNKFHNHELKKHLNLYNKTNKCTCTKYVSSHINYQKVSMAFAIVIRVALQEY